MRPTIRTAILILSLAILSFSTNLYAQPARNTDCQPDDKVVVFFGNGMETSEDEAYISRTWLLDALKKDVQAGKFTLPSGVQLDSICYQVAYNTDEPGWLDLFQAIRQFLAPNPTQTWQLISRLIKGPMGFQRAYAQIIAFYNSDLYVNDPAFQEQVTRYQKEIDAGRKIIVVAHPQGNFYVNQAYTRLLNQGNPPESFEIVAVATPDNVIADDLTNTTQTTLFGDIILQVPGNLDANTAIQGTPCIPGDELTFASSSFQCHGFIESYLTGTHSRERVLGQIISAIPISQPPPVYSINDTFTLGFFDVDDVLSAYITNSALTNELILTATFGQVISGVDVSGFIRQGRNVIHLELINISPGAGWTYGYDFKVNNISRDSDQCGVFNTFGCENDDQTQGLVWTHDIIFDVLP